MRTRKNYCARDFGAGEVGGGVRAVGGAAAPEGVVEPAVALGCCCAAAICDEPGWGRAPASLGSGSRNALRKPTSESLRDSAEAPDVEEEVWPAGGADGAEEATLGPGGADAAAGEDEAGATDVAVEADDVTDEDDAGEAASAGAAVDGDETDGGGEAEDVDDAGKREKDEHAASIGNSAIVAAAAPKRPPLLRRVTGPGTPMRQRHPIPHLYRVPGVTHKPGQLGQERSLSIRLGVWRNLIPGEFIVDRGVRA